MAVRSSSTISLAEPLEQVDRTYALFRGRKLIYFGGCDYYRLASNPHVLRSAARAIARDSLNVAASRVTTGNHPKYEQLEAALCAFFKVEDALLTSTGYVANLAIAQALAGEFSHAILDERAHGSLQDAARFLDCQILQYKHRDARYAAQMVARCGSNSKVILLTDGVFAHDGAIAPLPELLRALPRNGLLLLDDAHGAGVLGKNGRGTMEHFGIRDGRVIRAITLSKAFGAYGGAVLADKRLCRKIVARSGVFAASTPLPLPMAAAALTAIATVAGDDAMRARLRRNLKLIDKDVPIVSITPRSRQQAARVRKQLLNAGIYPSLIRYPGGPASGCFRFAISSEHSPEQIKRLLRVIAREV